MRQKTKSRSERGDGCLELLVARVDQALESLGEAEIMLRNLRVSCLPLVAESLAAAAADVESLQASLSIAGESKRNTPALQARMKSLEYAAGRVSALHQAAKDFHAGLMLARQGDMAEYDVLGGVCGNTELHTIPYGLEARG